MKTMADRKMHLHRYAAREELAEALASGIGAVLAGGIAMRGEARLAVSGGNTPALLFERLSKMPIEWQRVRITLTDERFVPASDTRSNAGLVRRLLLKDKAADARFLPLCDGEEPNADIAADAADHEFAMLGGLDAAILGMGLDGHTASFFPGGDQLADALDMDARRHVLAMNAPGAAEPRLTLGLRYLMEAQFVALHIEGDEKWAVFERASEGDDDTEMPVRAVLREANEKLHVFWAP